MDFYYAMLTNKKSFLSENLTILSDRPKINKRIMHLA